MLLKIYFVILSTFLLLYSLFIQQELPICRLHIHFNNPDDRVIISNFYINFTKIRNFHIKSLVFFFLAKLQ